MGLLLSIFKFPTQFFFFLPLPIHLIPGYSRTLYNYQKKSCSRTRQTILHHKWSLWRLNDFCAEGNMANVCSKAQTSDKLFHTHISKLTVEEHKRRETYIYIYNIVSTSKYQQSVFSNIFNIPDSASTISFSCGYISPSTILINIYPQFSWLNSNQHIRLSLRAKKLDENDLYLHYENFMKRRKQDESMMMNTTQC